MDTAKTPATRVAAELTADLRARLDCEAQRLGVSRSDILKLALTEYLERRDNLA